MGEIYASDCSHTNTQTFHTQTYRHARKHAQTGEKQNNLIKMSTMNDVTMQKV